jgi:hypothetical protein
MIGRRKDERRRFQHVRQGARIVFRIGRNFGEGHVAGRFDKFPEVTICDWGRINEKGVDMDVVSGSFFGVVLVRPHEKGTGRDQTRLTPRNSCFFKSRRHVSPDQ